MQLNYSKNGRAFISRALGFALLFFVGLAHAAESTVDTFADIETYIDGTIEAQMVLEDIPAVTVSVVKDGQRIFSKGYGTADFKNDISVNAENSLFRIGSTSKLFTWTSIMQLYEQGKVDLDADVNTYLEFSIPDTFDEPITLRHILSHSAGFEDGGLGYLIQYYPNAGPELADAMEKYIPARLNPPGKVTSYSNYGTALAGLIVQNVTGQPFNQYVDEHIFTPLDMEYTSFEEPLPKEMRKYSVKGYTREAGVFAEKPFEMINSFGPAGGVSSSADDMANFMIAHLNDGQFNGNQILKPETAQLMHSRLFAGDERLAGMAYGFYEHNFNGHRLIGHGGDTMQFHTDMVIDPNENLGIFVSYMSTVSSAGRTAFVKQFYDHYFPEEDEHIEPPANFSSRAEQYAGDYIFWRRNESTIEKVMGLFGGQTSVMPTGDGTLLVAGIYGERQYVEVGDNLFKQVDGDERIAFVADENGELTTLYYESLPFMSLQQAPLFHSMFFRVLLPLFCVLVFLHVLVTWGYKRSQYKAASPASRRLSYSAITTAAANVLFLIVFISIVLIYQDTLYSGLPFSFKLSLILPVLAAIFALVTTFYFVKRQVGESPRVASVIYYSIVVFAGLYMTFFYYYWNILGWNYM